MPPTGPAKCCCRAAPGVCWIATSRRAVAEGILGQIAAAKRSELARRFDGVSLDALRAGAVPTRRSLTRTLAQPRARFILEIKKASPSSGALRPEADVASL